MKIFILIATLAAANAQWDKPNLNAIDKSYTTTCTATADFLAQQFVLRDGTVAWPSDAWTALDENSRTDIDKIAAHTANGDALLAFRREDVPREVLNWVLSDGRTGVVAANHAIILAPDAFRASLPLWVAAASDCTGTLHSLSTLSAEYRLTKHVDIFLDLSKTTTLPRTGGVLAWAQSRQSDDATIVVSITARALRRKQKDASKSGKRGVTRPTEPVHKEEL